MIVSPYRPRLVSDVPVLKRFGFLVHLASFMLLRFGYGCVTKGHGTRSQLASNSNRVLGRRRLRKLCAVPDGHELLLAFPGVELLAVNGPKMKPEVR